MINDNNTIVHTAEKSYRKGALHECFTNMYNKTA